VSQKTGKNQAEVSPESKKSQQTGRKERLDGALSVRRRASETSAVAGDSLARVLSNRLGSLGAQCAPQTVCGKGAQTVHCALRLYKWRNSTSFLHFCPQLSQLDSPTAQLLTRSPARLLNLPPLPPTRRQSSGGLSSGAQWPAAELEAALWIGGWHARRLTWRPESSPRPVGSRRKWSLLEGELASLRAWVSLRVAKLESGRVAEFMRGELESGKKRGQFVCVCARLFGRD